MPLDIQSVRSHLPNRELHYFETIDTTIWGGHQGHMPTWESRLSELDRKILTLYLLDKRTAQP